MKKMNVGVVPLGDSQKGITLIALIITIIVMLILVGVTINVALNGGLFEKAKTAKDLTQKKADIEVLQSAAIAAFSIDTNEVDFEELNKETVKLGFEGENGKYTKAGITYKVNKNTGEVKEDDGSGAPTLGTYTIYIEDEYSPTTIELTSNSKGHMSIDSQSVEFDYEYSEEEGKIYASAYGETVECYYRVIGNTQIIIMGEDFNNAVIYTKGEINETNNTKIMVVGENLNRPEKICIDGEVDVNGCTIIVINGRNLDNAKIYTNKGINGITPLAGKTYEGMAKIEGEDKKIEYIFRENGVLEISLLNVYSGQMYYFLIDNIVYIPEGNHYNEFILGNNYETLSCKKEDIYLSLVVPEENS